MPTLAASLLFAAAAQFAEDVAVAPPDPLLSCGADPVARADPQAVLERHEAPAGSRFFLRRHDPARAPLDDDLAAYALQDGTGARIDVAAVDVSVSPAAISLPVPDAPPGTVYALLVNGEPYPGVALRVAPAPDEEQGPSGPLQIHFIELADAAAAACELQCTTGFDQAPPLAVLRVSVEGGPGLLDVWALEGGGEPLDSTPRVVDTFYVEATSEPISLELVASHPLSTFMSVDFVARARSVDDLQQVDEELLFSGPIGPVPIEPAEDVPPCGGGGGPVGPPVLGCVSAADAAPALGLLALLRLRRRR